MRMSNILLIEYRIVKKEIYFSLEKGCMYFKRKEYVIEEKVSKYVSIMGEILGIIRYK